MKIKAIKCLKCGGTIFSRSVHDFRWCSCESVAIDGGFEYTKVSGNPENYEFKDINVKATKTQLYKDWEHRTDKYGLIKKEVKKK